MSFVRAVPAKPVNSSFQLELVANPKEKFTHEQGVAQKDIIAQVTAASNGLFLPNPAVQVNDSVKSAQTYSKGVHIEDLAAAMKDYNLVLRVSVSGDHNACAMATHEDLVQNASIHSPTGSFSLNTTGNYIQSVDFL